MEEKLLTRPVKFDFSGQLIWQLKEIKREITHLQLQINPNIDDGKLRDYTVEQRRNRCYRNKNEIVISVRW